MAFYSYIFTANYKRFFKNLRQVAKENHRFFPWLVLDTGWCVFRYGLGLTDYLNFKIYERTAAQRREYVGARMENTFYACVSPAEYKLRYTIKPRFLKEFHQYTKRDFLVPEEAGFEKTCEFIEQHPVFMLKPFDGLGGQDVTKERAENIKDKEAFFKHCTENRMYLEELILQHEEMNRLCPKSVNTLRIMTFNDHGRSEILWMGLRVGNGVNDIDNFHAKGMGVRIDPETGRLSGMGYDKDGNAFERHPTTGVLFDGFQIPCFQQVREMVLKASLESDKILVFGWDVAISTDGPVIIEGNRRPGFDLVQVLDDRGRMDMVRSCMARARGEANPPAPDSTKAPTPPDKPDAPTAVDVPAAVAVPAAAESSGREE